MKTVDKALRVLDQFSLEHTEIGLSEMARMADLDKAATRRLLVAMAKHDFIEQSLETRKYRLGKGFLRLARIREATVPIAKAAQEVADWLCAETKETAHISLPGQNGMTTIGLRLPNRGRVVNLAAGENLYYHATASGLVYLSAASPKTADRILALKREKVTSFTVTDKAELMKAIDRFRAQGFGETRNSFEVDVAGVAMPFGRDGDDPAGSIALALPDAELTDARRDGLLPLLREAVERIERATAGS